MEPEKGWLVGLAMGANGGAPLLFFFFLFLPSACFASFNRAFN